VTDTGTIAAQNLVLGVTGSGSTLLTTDATKGLHVTVQSCVLPWAAGACLAPTTVINNQAVATLTTTPASLVSGAVAKNSAYHYKVTTTLPDQNETTTNGTLPGTTIQNLSTTLTFTFDEAQRDATNVDS
jgi:spore coat-associated protein N